MHIYMFYTSIIIIHDEWKFGIDHGFSLELRRLIATISAQKHNLMMLCHCFVWIMSDWE